MDPKKKVSLIIERLEKYYPDAKTALNYKNPQELLVATILSAQTTDKTVNAVTPSLFKKYKTCSDFASADPQELSSDIGKVNFRNNKAKNIIASCKIITEKYQNKVPDTMEKLTGLPGVARKTANVILGTIFGKAEGIVVDTHVIRLSNRLGLTSSKDPAKIEQDLMKIVPKNKWIIFSHLLISFGREFCPARKHVCSPCPLLDLCPDQ